MRLSARFRPFRQSIEAITGREDDRGRRHRMIPCPGRRSGPDRLFRRQLTVPDHLAKCRDQQGKRSLQLRVSGADRALVMRMTATGHVAAIPPPAITGNESQHEHDHAVDSRQGLNGCRRPPEPVGGPCGPPLRALRKPQSTAPITWRVAGRASRRWSASATQKRPVPWFAKARRGGYEPPLKLLIFRDNPGAIRVRFRCFS